MAFSEDQRKHLEIIQGTITRMSGHSFLIRGWTVTLATALFALAAKDSEQKFVYLSYFPCAVFCCLDAYYLSQERKFRSLYDHVRESKIVDYGMDTGKTASGRDKWVRSLFSSTVLLFHGSIIGAIAFVAGYLKK